MPPKIKEMAIEPNTNSKPVRRFTLMIGGEDALDPQAEQPPCGLPQERFLLGKRVPIAPILLLGQSDLVIDPQLSIACLQPVHLHATRDHLVLLNQTQLGLTQEESNALLKPILPLLEEDFHSPLLFHNASFYFIPAGPFASLATHSLDQSHGRNIDWWMPRDSHEEGASKRWRKLQNEIQMLWHIDAINQVREQSGKSSINSIWISGLGKLADVEAPNCFKEIKTIYGNKPLLKGLAKFLNIPQSADVNPDQLEAGFADTDDPEPIWGMLSTALENKQLDEVILIDFPNGRFRERTFTRKSLHQQSWMFWRKAKKISWQDMIGTGT